MRQLQVQEYHRPPSRLTWFMVGWIALAVAEGVAWANYTKAWQEPPPTVEPVVAQKREFVFKVLAPVGYEEVAYVQLNCDPNIKAIQAKKNHNPLRKKGAK